MEQAQVLPVQMNVQPVHIVQEAQEVVHHVQPVHIVVRKLEVVQHVAVENGVLPEVQHVVI